MKNSILVSFPDPVFHSRFWRKQNHVWHPISKNLFLETAPKRGRSFQKRQKEFSVLYFSSFVHSHFPKNWETRYLENSKNENENKLNENSKRNLVFGNDNKREYAPRSSWGCIYAILPSFSLSCFLFGRKIDMFRALILLSLVDMLWKNLPR